MANTKTFAIEIGNKGYECAVADWPHYMLLREALAAMRVRVLKEAGASFDEMFKATKMATVATMHDVLQGARNEAGMTELAAILLRAANPGMSRDEAVGLVLSDHEALTIILERGVTAPAEAGTA